MSSFKGSLNHIMLIFQRICIKTAEIIVLCVLMCMKIFLSISIYGPPSVHSSILFATKKFITVYNLHNKPVMVKWPNSYPYPILHPSLNQK